MWNNIKINSQPYYSNPLLFDGYGINRPGYIISYPQGSQAGKPAITIPLDTGIFLEQYLRDLFKATESELKQKRELLAGKTLKEQLKGLIHLGSAEERRDPFDDSSNFIHEFFRKARTKASLLRIKKKINTLARKINAPRKLRPSYGPFDYELDSYFIEIDKKGVIRLIETEKGQVHEVRRTRDLDELLYWIFSNITFTMAYKLAMENPTGEMDRRKLIFLFQEDLLARLYPHWREKKHAEYEEFLKKHPKDEIKGRGREYYDGLRKQIHVEIVENSASYFRFPPS